ncbi:MAG: TonB family protein [Cryomorphaceae bacterium]|jgi:TonB family protein
MIDTILYALEANLYLALFALFYYFALRKEKNYLANRLVLISSVFLAWTIPGISYLEPLSNILPVIGLERITISPNAIADSPTVLSFSFQDALASVYIGGVVIGSIVFIKRLFGILSILSRNSQSTDSSLKLIETDSVEAWSFFNLVALGKNIPTENKEWILEHERVHVNEKHSIDKLIIQLVKIFGWFNPAVYFLEFALEENHEFRADEVVCVKFSNSITYSHVLVSQSLGGVPVNLLGHQFSKKSLLKSRIQMINQTKQTGKMKYLLTIPVLAVALLFHSCTKEDSTTETDSTPLASSILVQNTGDELYEVVEKMPEFKGGMDGLFKFMSENTVYPKSASKSDESGKVLVSFIIDEAGNVTEPAVVNAKSIASVALRNAALETLGKMPAWTPGEQDGKAVKVLLTLPINFELE